LFNNKQPTTTNINNQQQQPTPGKMTPWTGRFWTLLDPTYAKKYIPIIASVSEHQPTTWATYIFDLHALVRDSWMISGLTGG
jgi:hypothetical protein